MESLFERLAEEFSILPKQVEDTVELIDQGCTIPFIARYRKEVTGNLDDVILRELNDRLDYLRKLDKRKEEIISNIREQGKLTEALQQQILNAKTLQEAEDLYLPYKKKKRTRAMVAREKGLEPLAEAIVNQKMNRKSLEDFAQSFVDAEKEIPDSISALQGAMDIVAEEISEKAEHRQALRKLAMEKGVLYTAVTKDFAQEKTEFENYYDYKEALKNIADHRILAVNRGEKKKVLSVKIDAGDYLLNWLKKEVRIKKGVQTEYLEQAIEDGYKRLLFPAVEREIRAMLKEKAEESAIRNFSLNLKHLLLQPPFKEKVVMGFDPGFRTGCKVAVLDALGRLRAYATIYPTAGSKEKKEQAEKILLDMISRFKIDIIAIGNGTASRESEQFIAEVLKKTERKVQYAIVSEAGASVYSASDLAARTYPDLDVTIRGAISIGGRLQDPLSELVKIDPKHIGVGQYQHDVNQKALEKVLDETVEDAVNNVGVNINRASPELLKYVSGINKTIAQNIIDYRSENGRFLNRADIKKVKGLGAKAFEQCAGFLRIPGSAEILDNTAVHPESYDAARALIKILNLTKEDLSGKHLKDTAQVLDAVNVPEMAEKLRIGEPTLRDIIKELKKPGRDPRDAAPKPFLKSDVLSIEDLKPGMELTGTVRNVIDFGAFVDIGVHEDGLVHISEISNRFIRHPSEVLAIGDVVTVSVLSVDVERRRIGLSMLI